ncbi:diaminopimelate decarboxylase [Chitinivibrio alkaliphilus]|uniref:Diaminopimelate decarboxylase n=1 Tax=Chitinivibrio alkaliphilus ACht1 TaxID=1313304 RepID=U7D9L6_9BACT|nr:diaminopimelate decarboxylase [Chitinivibrio alkaliphilus]ERP38717.1 Diaminopimelate decarboxylase [Chitinivibrio alkaliphilus ACht1]
MKTTTIGPNRLPVEAVQNCLRRGKTPFYLYDQGLIRKRCRLLQEMPNAFGVFPRYAMKANSTRAILQEIHAAGVGIDASSFNEVRRAEMAGIPLENMLLTTQEAPFGEDLDTLVTSIEQGLRYNICSQTQLENIAVRLAPEKRRFSIRVHPGVGSGESVTRNTGDKYSCFGVHLSDLPALLSRAHELGVVFDQVHVHIGSGGDPAVWEENIDRELGFVETYFPQATRVNFGGGFKEARMPHETAADVYKLGQTAKKKVEEFYEKTGRKLTTEVEPGNFLVANSGYLVTRVADIKQTGDQGFTFILLDGGMEVNLRPLLYGAQHPFYILDEHGTVRFDEFHTDQHCEEREDLIVVGRCCESGDSYTLQDDHAIVPRSMIRPRVGDTCIVGGVGAYCSSMTPFNYNSHEQISEYLLTERGECHCIRSRQRLEQIVQNEHSLPPA